jgi:hypothetical protein
LLLQEIALAKRQKHELEEKLLNKSVELTRVKENLNLSTAASNDSFGLLSKHEQQSDHLRRDNIQLRAELNESRSLLIARDNLIKDLQRQVIDPSLHRTSFNDLHVSVIDSLILTLLVFKMF